MVIKNCSYVIEIWEKSNKMAKRQIFSYSEEAGFDAARDGNLSVLRQYLQQAGVSVNDKYKTRRSSAYYGRTVLHVSAIHGKKETVTALVNECGADVNARVDESWAIILRWARIPRKIKHYEHKTLRNSLNLRAGALKLCF